MFFTPHSGANQNGGQAPHMSDIIYMSHSISFIPSLDSTLTTSSSTFSNRLSASCINQPTSLVTPIKGTSDSPYLDMSILQIGSSILLYLVSSCFHQMFLLHNRVMLLMFLSSFAGDDGLDQF